MKLKPQKSIGMDLFGGIASGMKFGRKKQLTDALRIYSERNFTLAYIINRNLLGRTPDYLKKLCRDSGIAFRDYEPVTPIKKRSKV